MKFLLIVVVILGCWTGSSCGKYEGWPSEVIQILEDDELRNWKGPPVIEDNYKYYQSGVDHDGKPVWIMEWGRWNMRRIIEKKLQDDFDRFNDRMYVHLTESLANVTKEGDEWVPGLTIIIDTEGFTADQLTSPETVAFILRLFRISLSKMRRLADRTYVINAHFLVQNMINLLRPILGDALDDVMIFGTDKARWQTQLKNDLPLDALPEWYGGKKGFQPVKVYG